VLTRSIALEVLARVEDDGAFANLALAAALGRSSLDQRDRAMVTDLVNGTLRSRRYLDFVLARHLQRPAPPAARRALRLGAYQLLRRADIPPYAAVSATVSATPKRYRGLANAVLRRVADEDVGDPPEPPDVATRLSYPDWIVSRLVEDLGESRALGALASMNFAPTVAVRPDGYVQDPASRSVVDVLGVQPGETVLDLCASPGGKATAIAGEGAFVVAVDLGESRVRLLKGNAGRFGGGLVGVVRGDATRVPFRARGADRVLLDAPCSGLGVLRRRADARWRVEPDAPDELAALQRSMLDAAVGCLRPGGVLVYSVCTLTAVESLGVDRHLEQDHPGLVPEPPGAPWEPWGRGGILLPEAAHDGMCVFRYRLGGGGRTPRADGRRLSEPTARSAEMEE
jgi:16S rRNA (cytosine967-C5)-methyltransferase